MLKNVDFSWNCFITVRFLTGENQCNNLYLACLCLLYFDMGLWIICHQQTNDFTSQNEKKKLLSSKAYSSSECEVCVFLICKKPTNILKNQKYTYIIKQFPVNKRRNSVEEDV